MAPGSNAEFRVLRPDGEVRWLNHSEHCFGTSKADPVVSIGAARDITERKQAEQALRTSNEELLDFHYAVSHDLQEPLRTVMAFAQLLHESLNGHHSENDHNYIRFIRDGFNQLNILFRDLRMYTEVSQDAGDGPGFVDCNAILEEVY